MAGTTGLEPAASAVTGQRSNQLNYVPSPNSLRNSGKNELTICRMTVLCWNGRNFDKRAQGRVAHILILTAS
jgi:hypothetical protein